MKVLLSSLTIGLLLMNISCVPSVNPLFTEQDLIFEPALLGTWSNPDGTETWIFTLEDDKEYRAVFRDSDGKKGEFAVNLLRIEGKMFLDLSPIRTGPGESDFYRSHFLPMHTFVHVSIASPNARLAILEPDWLKAHLAAEPTALRHEKVSGEVVLTASTKELQAFYLKHLSTPNAFSDPEDFVRTKRAGAK